MVTREDYYRITNCVGEFRLPDFTIEEVQQFLIKKGYRIEIYKGTAKIHEVTMDGGEVNRTGKTWDDERECILALKEGESYSGRIDVNECHEKNFVAVFEREMKAHLLGL